MTSRVMLTIGAGLLMGACAGPVEEPVAEVTTATSIHDTTMPATAPLVEIMGRLSEDMSGTLEGLWRGDREAVAYHAKRIADHSKVTAAEMAFIQRALGPDFPSFVSSDQRVHLAAISLGEAVEKGADATDLLGIVTGMQEGCVSCHETFQVRLAKARVENDG